MKKNIIIITLLVLSGTLLAQSPIARGHALFNVGSGVSSKGIPVYLGLDMWVHPDITVGGDFSYRSYDDKAFGDSRSVAGITFKGNYHFNKWLKMTPGFDLSAGVNLGYYIWDSSASLQSGLDNEMKPGVHVGTRYFFSEKYGVNAEFSARGIFNELRIGLSMKL